MTAKTTAPHLPRGARRQFHPALHTPSFKVCQRYLARDSHRYTALVLPSKKGKDNQEKDLSKEGFMLLRSVRCNSSLEVRSETGIVPEVTHRRETATYAELASLIMDPQTLIGGEAWGKHSSHLESRVFLDAVNRADRDGWTKEVSRWT